MEIAMPFDEERGDDRLLRHAGLRPVGQRPPVRERLEAELGAELVHRLVAALTAGKSRRGEHRAA